MAEYIDQTFTAAHGSLQFDGNSFVRCESKGATFVYRGLPDTTSHFDVKFDADTKLVFGPHIHDVLRVLAMFLATGQPNFVAAVNGALNDALARQKPQGTPS